MTKALPSLLLCRSEGLCLRLLLLWLVGFGSLDVPSPVVSSAAAETVSSSSVLITQALQSAQEILQRSKSQPPSASAATSTLPDSWQEQVQTIQDAVDRYSTLRQERDALIRQVNVRLIQQLIDQLQTIREAVTEQSTASASSSADNPTIRVNTSEDDRWWKDQLDPTVVLKPAEEALEAWIETLMWQELEQFQQQQQQLSLSPSDSPQQEHQCLTAGVAITHMQTALNQFAQDGIGRDDLFQQPGTVIVHELTSSTYQSPLSDSTAADVASSQPSKWHQKWMPQDWEDAWMWLRREHAVVADTLERLLQPQLWPSHLYHTLRIASSSTSAPPETVLQKSLWPGACWPVAMKIKSASRNSNSHTHKINPAITIRLATPRVVTALSLDHVSGHLAEDRSTAPQRVRVYGYAPCTTNSHCDGRGFDVNSKFILANELVYDLDGSFNIQTFPLGPESPHPNDADQQDTTGSCAAPAGEAACGEGQTSSTVAAVTVEILSNYGHPDYTCLYRVRIHANDDDHTD